MKILAFVDMHGNLKAFEEIKQKSKNSDLIICAGDISVFENNIRGLLLKLNSLKKTTLMIHGNHESATVMKKLCSAFDNILFIHNALYTFGNYQFLGYGGGGFSDTDRAFELFAKKAKKDVNKKKKLILITHAPPYNTNLDLITNNHHGNKSIRSFIKQNRVDAAISGHLHECAYQTDRLNNAFLINPGPRGRLVKVEDE